MRTFPRRYSGRAVAANSDKALWGFPIPPGGTLNKLNFDTHVIGPEGSDIADGFMYGMSVWHVAIDDLDDTNSYDSLWNIKVPKDEAETEGGFNLDEVSDTQPEFAAGAELDWNSVFEIDEAAGKEIFRRRVLMTIASSFTGFVAGTPDTFLPVDRFRGRINSRSRMRGASVVMAGFSSPEMATTQTAAQDLVPTEKQWVQLKFLDLTLRQALISAIGLIASGTQEPYSEALAWIARYLEPAILSEAGSIFQSALFNVFSKASADITIPSANIGGNLSSE